MEKHEGSPLPMPETLEMTAGLHPCPPVDHSVQVQAQPAVLPGDEALIS